MLRYSFSILFGLLLTVGVTGQESEKIHNTGINITPVPSKLTVSEGFFSLNEKTTIYINTQSDELKRIVRLFAIKIKNSAGLDIAVVGVEKEHQIRITIDENLNLKQEGYLLKSDHKVVNIKASDMAGIFYAMQTMIQLLPAEIESPDLQKNIQWKIPSVEIRDEPRFAYRGFLVDSGRHFWSVDFIKKQLDIMAMLKINRLHWHLTDDQGWRVEIKKYPDLTKIGSQRKEHDGTIYGPYYYTQEDIKEIVAYAKKRFIEVIPEIDMPGHAVAAVAAYPEYSCTGGPHSVRNVWGISSDIFCAGNEQTYTFIEDILDEILPLFESNFIHLGGDEADKYQWERCPKCQLKMKELKLVSDKKASAENKLQSYFMGRIESYLARSGKKIIGWEEMVDGNLSPSATVMSWRGLEKGIEAANLGNNVIMSPRPYVYLDQPQGDAKLLPPAPPRYVPLEKTYSLDPVPESLDVSKHNQILGTQAATWAEYIPTEDLFEWYTYPRLIALAEVAWSKPDNKNYKEFLRRLDNQRVRLDMHKVNYYIPLPEQKNVPSANFVAFNTNIILDLCTTEPVTILYTTDGTEPNDKSAVYKTPLIFDETKTLKVRSLLLLGKLGEVRTIHIEKQDFIPSIEKTPDYRGLKVKYYTGFENKVDNLFAKIPVLEEIIEEPQLLKDRIKNNSLLTEGNARSVIVEGYITIPIDAVYYFSTNCDQFWINDKLLISNEGFVKRNSNNDKSIALAKGYHKFRMIRLADICGGWVPQWESVTLSIRSENEDKFRVMKAVDFR